MATALVPGVDYPRSRRELLRWFATQEQCRNFLTRLRYPAGYTCQCGSARYWWRSPTVMRCKDCSRESRLLAGTIFEKTRTPLPVWFEAAWAVATPKNGISATELQRDMGLGSYETAWSMLHRFRRAMVFSNRSKLRGHVEVDETVIGGVSPGQFGRGTKGQWVVIACETPAQRKVSRVRLATIPNASAQSLQDFIDDNIEPGSTVITDAWRGYSRVASSGYTHEVHNVSGSGQHAHTLLPNVHLVASLLKRWMLGTHQGRISRDHMQSYLDEFVFRFNRRRGTNIGLHFHRLIEGAIEHGPETYEDIKGGP